MIFDAVENLKKYANIPEQDAILKFLQETDVSKLTEGDIEIKGKDLYVKVLRYVPKDAAENNFETHEIYTDVQMIINGEEKMQIVNTKYLQEITGYDKEGDFQFFSAQKYISDIVVRENEFVVFFPGEPHKPGCNYQQRNEPILKLVFKVKDI